MLNAFPALLRRGKPSISRKLTQSVVIAVLTAVCLVAAGAVWQEAQRHTAGKLDYLNATAAVFASATSRAAAQSDANGALAAMRAVARAPGVHYARVERMDGVRLAELGSGVLLDSDGSLASGASISPLAALRSRSLSVTYPIVHGGEQVGRLVLVVENTDLAPRLFATLAQTLGAAFLALLVGLLIATRLKTAVLRPLVNLTEVVRDISRSHNYVTRTPIETDDEVGELCSGFNTMLDEIQDRERRIVDLAMHDSETDLPNRMAFEREIERRIENGATFAVAAVGIDRFQMIRGAIGYQLTNDLISEIGARLAGFHAARIANDVLGCIFHIASEDAAREKGGLLLLEAEEPVLLGENTLDVNVSIGVAMIGVPADAPRMLVERANIALDQARAARQKVQLFDESAYVHVADNVSLMGDMMRALHNGEMSVALQPKYDIRTRSVSGAELLVRWRHPVRGLVAPDLFIGMAEETGVIGVLTEWTLRQAIAAQMRLMAEGFAPSIAVNISGRLLDDAAFIAVAKRLIEEASGQICLEITETATIGNQEAGLRNVAELKALGAHIALDDYGQGLSSLTYLRRFPADELKIDKTFVLRLGESRRDALLVKSTVDLAHSLGLQVTAEGVETEAALAALSAMGCDFAQGYLIAKPMPEADFLRFMREMATAEARSA